MFTCQKIGRYSLSLAMVFVLISQETNAIETNELKRILAAKDHGFDNVAIEYTESGFTPRRIQPDKTIGPLTYAFKCKLMCRDHRIAFEKTRTSKPDESGIAVTPYTKWSNVKNAIVCATQYSPNDKQISFRKLKPHQKLDEGRLYLSKIRFCMGLGLSCVERIDQVVELPNEKYSTTGTLNFLGRQYPFKATLDSDFLLRELSAKSNVGEFAVSTNGTSRAGSLSLASYGEFSDSIAGRDRAGMGTTFEIAPTRIRVGIEERELYEFGDISIDEQAQLMDPDGLTRNGKLVPQKAPVGH